MTLYLKYRPQKIADLDLDGVREGLLKIVSSGRMPHAFLFCGPRGAGKTSTARILAKVVNCENLQNFEPCNECSQCISITKGSSMDVIEIDAASNRGVDDIRSLRETVKLSASGSNKKVYIVDEAHMLTTEAANALLKTLEEPPTHVVFILATTAPEKLLDTIRSRCTILNFTKGTETEIKRALQKVIDSEKFEVETEALDEIVKIVDGSFREAHKILEQLSFSGKINAKDVRLLTSNSSEDPHDLITLIREKNIEESLLLIGKVAEKGTNMKTYTVELISILRKALLAHYMAEKGDEKIVGLSVTEIQKMLETFSDAVMRIPQAVIPQLPLEMAVVKLLANEKQDTFAINQKNESVLNTKVVPVAVKKEEVPVTIKKVDIALNNIELPKEEVEKVLQPVPLVLSALETEELNKLWGDIVRLAKAKNFSIEALLRACKPMSFDGKDLQIEVFYQFHKERLESQVYRTIIESAAEEITGGKLRLVCLLSEEKKKAADVLNVAEAKDSDITRAAEEIFGAPVDGKVH